MLRHRSAWFAVILLILTSLACNAFAGANLEPTSELPTPAVTTPDMTLTPTVDGLAPTATVPGGVEETPGAAAAAINVLVDLNVRSGPGVHYDRVGFLLQGETARVIGVDPLTGWWKVECPPRAEGTECWVSGGSQYSAASNVDGVPVAAAPPTSTPVPPTAAPASPTPEPTLANDTGSNVVVAGNGLLAYADNSGLWVVPLDVSLNPLAPGEPLQVVGGASVEQVLIAPDGQKIAYLTATSEANALHVVNVDGSGRKTLVNSGGLPVAVEGDVSNLVAMIANVQWRANSQALVFNTNVVNLVGPGVISQEDLWSVNLDGALTERFAAGEGGAYALSPANKVLMGQSEHIVRADWDGDNWEEVIEFDFINTASEYVYYPKPQWTADGSRAYVAIPSAEQFSPDATVNLWQIPANGPAELLETLPGNILFNPVVWSPNGNALAYVQQLISNANPPPELILASSGGQSPTPYDVATQLTFHAWAPNSSHFLYSGPDFYAAGRMGAAPVEVATSNATAAMRWLNASSFVAATGSAGAWNLHSANLAGETTSLATINSQFPAFDVWTP